MWLNAITCCVGKNYRQKLLSTIDRWLLNVDHITIVTVEEECDKFPKHDQIRVITSKSLYSFGASFNKAAALCEAYIAAHPTDWILHFDCDIVPPQSFRKILEKNKRMGCLHGVFRYTERGNLIDKEGPLHPYGYFHLWHITDRSSWKWPIFNVGYPHAGNYDAEFANQWPDYHRVDLGFKVVHKGFPRRNWFGSKNVKKLKSFRKKKDLTVEEIRKFGTLQLPKPKRKFVFSSKDQWWVVDALRLCGLTGPFNVQAVVSDLSIKDYERIDQLDLLQKRLNDYSIQ